MSQQQDIQKFQKYIDVILPQVRRLRYSKILYFKYFQIAETKESLLHNYFSEWLPHAYTAQAVMAIRRLTDKQSTKYRKVSLVTLLEELKKSSSVFTREKFIADELGDMHKNAENREISEKIANKVADPEFTRVFGSGKHLEINKLNADLEKITENTTVKKIRDFVDKNYAHTDEDGTEYPAPTYGETNACIDMLTDIFKKYHRLIKGGCYHLSVLDAKIGEDVEKVFNK